MQILLHRTPGHPNQAREGGLPHRQRRAPGLGAQRLFPGLRNVTCCWNRVSDLYSTPTVMLREVSHLSPGPDEAPWPRRCARPASQQRPRRQVAAGGRQVGLLLPSEEKEGEIYMKMPHSAMLCFSPHPLGHQRVGLQSARGGSGSQRKTRLLHEQPREGAVEGSLHPLPLNPHPLPLNPHPVPSPALRQCHAGPRKPSAQSPSWSTRCGGMNKGPTFCSH